MSEPQKNDLSALIARLEPAEVGSRELDWAVGAALFTGVRGCAAPNATTSLDAAHALAERVLPGVDWRLSAGRHWKPMAEFWPASERLAVLREAIVGQAKTPALALCIAILRALEVKA